MNPQSMNQHQSFARLFLQHSRQHLPTGCAALGKDGAGFFDLVPFISLSIGESELQFDADKQGWTKKELDLLEELAKLMIQFVTL